MPVILWICTFPFSILPSKSRNIHRISKLNEMWLSAHCDFSGKHWSHWNTHNTQFTVENCKNMATQQIINENDGFVQTKWKLDNCYLYGHHFEWLKRVRFGWMRLRTFSRHFMTLYDSLWLYGIRLARAHVNRINKKKEQTITRCLKA